jgi:hypothetical protein
VLHVQIVQTVVGQDGRDLCAAFGALILRVHEEGQKLFYGRRGDIAAVVAGDEDLALEVQNVDCRCDHFSGGSGGRRATKQKRRNERRNKTTVSVARALCSLLFAPSPPVSQTVRQTAWTAAETFRKTYACAR